ncbi:hypothetical protein BKA15_006694 [Microlunatus parietis]|uniref:Uncharacterized protein n=1 Tax=Microlunatus parietis TaxID=682979 RepID=A0A7Y9IEK6_9ACTN|nr:hypothetical protein [Microlunatus parietis]
MDQTRQKIPYWAFGPTEAPPTGHYRSDTPQKPLLL